MLITLACKSLANRRKSVVLTFLSLLISISVLLSVEHIRLQAKQSFSRSITGVDLIVGAPSGQLNLLLYAVFRMGSATNNISYESYELLKNNKQVEWAVPISLGDSHRGFRVMATDESYFKHYKYGDAQPLKMQGGKVFSDLFDVVIGADVAKKLNYKLGDKIVIAHGIGSTSFTKHDNTPFVISGILKATGTPVDNTLHISLPAIEAIHLPASKQRLLLNDNSAIDLTPKSVTAVMLGLKSKFTTFTLQRQLNNYRKDRLMAMLPGVAMTELWQLMGTVEQLLRVISLLVLLSSLFGLSTMLLASMQQRKGEIAVLRVVGASPVVILSLILLEALVVVLAASVSSVLLLSASLMMLGDWLATEFGLFLVGGLFTWHTLQMAGLVTVAAIITALLPAREAYKSALHASLLSY
ncbi:MULTISPECIES: ABC transporter permease [unclassified Pseudoalteromonas]|uniref:ABC transporter permease n=1 Tax=unclassified Pseudoalteromonas TaxID=194690 RepID=UPI0025B346A6|nr:MULTISPECIES: ABC transporter permease [unclassified Pseudoalteromonas]MDN3378653.1 ABC transporter permease [Pseudoalteromonas sp. APC 3893]MDN3387142.1 ABC transporter permease [Pseudoalteromonas sp. APC 4017]